MSLLRRNAEKSEDKGEVLVGMRWRTLSLLFLNKEKP